jgi:hypothetical protein
MGEETEWPIFPFGQVWTKTAGRNEEFAQPMLDKKIGELSVTDLIDFITALGLDVKVQTPKPETIAKRKAQFEREKAARAARKAKAA